MNISTNNYFELFSLQESFQIDIPLLTKEYKKLQAQYHPDKLVNEDETLRLQALQISSILNDAFNTLMSPLKRAAYLLLLHDVDPEENNQAHLGNEFLFSQIELREKLESLADKKDIDNLDQFKILIKKQADELLADFEALYNQKDYSSAKPVYSKLQFFFKLLEEIDLLEEKLLDY